MSTLLTSYDKVDANVSLFKTNQQPGNTVICLLPNSRHINKGKSEMIRQRLHHRALGTILNIGLDAKRKEKSNNNQPVRR